MIYWGTIWIPPLVVVADHGGRVQRAGEAEEGAVIGGDDAPPSLAGGRRADEPQRGVEGEEYQLELVVRDVVDAQGLHDLAAVPLISARCAYINKSLFRIRGCRVPLDYSTDRPSSDLHWLILGKFLISH
jgi:hypothetical protein